MNRNLFEALRPSGLLAIIDFPPRWVLSFCTPKGIPSDRGGHGIQEDLLIQEVTQAGFRFLQKAGDWPGSTYCLLFQKP
jgi:predicted methyltransferase